METHKFDLVVKATAPLTLVRAAIIRILDKRVLWEELGYGLHGESLDSETDYDVGGVTITPTDSG